MEAAADVVGRAVLLTAGNCDVGRDVLAVYQDPSHWSPSPTLVELARALVGFVEPVLKSPHVRLLLSEASR